LITTRFEERKDRLIMRPSGYNRKLYKEYMRHNRLQKRYKEYTVKPPKDRSLDKAWARGESVFINRDWKIKKFGFEKMYEDFGFGYSKEQIHEEFVKLDKNNDGTVDFVEWLVSKGYQVEAS